MEWIKIEEGCEMPDAFVNVWGCYESNKDNIVQFYFSPMKNEWVMAHCRKPISWFDTKLTHWMPINKPEPPKD